MNRLRHRKAAILASLSFASQRAFTNTGAISSGTPANDTPQQVTRYAAQAIEVLAGVDKNELSEVEKAEYDETALRVGAIRWAALPANTLPKRLTIVNGEPGQTCLVIASNNETNKRCTYGVVWPQSTSVSPNGQMISIAVQPNETWREVWLLRKVDNAWVFEVLPPSTQTTSMGIVEFAGWVPADSKQEARILIARDVLEKSKVRTTFEVLKASSLNVDGRANHPQT
jgi:hypothetical protein